MIDRLLDRLPKDPNALDELAERLADRLEAEAALDCAVCGDLPDHAETLSTQRDPQSLPRAAYAFIPERLLRVDRCRAVVRCRGCETRWRYRRDYEFLVGGSEDEEFLDRLTVTAQIARLREANRNGWRDPGAEAAHFLRLALADEREPKARALRRRLRHAMTSAPEAVEITQLEEALHGPISAEQRAIASCPICSRLPEAADPMPAIARYISPSSSLGLVRCDWCRTPYQVDFTDDYEGRRIERRSAETSLARAKAGDPAAIEHLHEWLDHAHLEWPGPTADADDPLHFLVGNDLYDAIREILADGVDPNRRDGHRWTPLMRAAIRETPTALDMLVAADAELDARNLVGETALYLAAEAGRVENVRRLLAAGADPSIACDGPSTQSKRLGIRGVAAAGTTPLQVADHHGHAAVVEVLGEAG